MQSNVENDVTDRSSAAGSPVVLACWLFAWLMGACSTAHQSKWPGLRFSNGL